MAVDSGGLPPIKKTQHKTLRLVVASLVALVVVVLIGGLVSYNWYNQSLQPLDTSHKQKIRFIIHQGEGNAKIAQNLQKAGIIRSSSAMVLYLQFAHKPAGLQAGTYAISPSLNVPKIVEHLEKGKTDLFMVTILPGRSLAELKQDLIKDGYSGSEIDTAFKAKYDSPLLADKPVNAGLEGYIFPETFEMQADDSLQKLFQKSFDTLYDRLNSDGLIEKFKAHNLNIHQALTLASIIQKEASEPSDQPQVAQVFLTRLQSGIKLESDVTFLYAAKKLGVQPSVDLQSPYNTRLVSGLPPTPISNMNYSALQAVVNPAQGDYLYFVAGDNGKIYYGKTLQEHQDNIKKYCQKLCQTNR